MAARRGSLPAACVALDEIVRHLIEWTVEEIVHAHVIVVDADQDFPVGPMVAIEGETGALADQDAVGRGDASQDVRRCDCLVEDVQERLERRLYIGNKRMPDSSKIGPMKISCSASATDNQRGLHRGSIGGHHGTRPNRRPVPRSGQGIAPWQVKMILALLIPDSPSLKKRRITACTARAAPLTARIVAFT